MIGSSPRVWGTSLRSIAVSEGRRFIPTCVGNMHALRSNNGGTDGSSPRVWGTFYNALNFRVMFRFIPTCVGNIVVSSACGHLSAVHPHVCGEHSGGGEFFLRPARFIPTCVGNILVKQDAQPNPVGSSPRVWGTSFKPKAPVKGKRFIPTCVGNMQLSRWSCGVKSGSSPRVWGTWLARQRRLSFWRFIPTCVGNIRSTPTRRAGTTVHPHVCGEHKTTVTLIANDDGSSPRVWGTYRFNQRGAVIVRFIPTCVGNISAVFVQLLTMAVHPHVCGEHSWKSARYCRFGGSSPRVWGTFVLDCIRSNPGRFIPTCVGNMHGFHDKNPADAVHPHVCGEHCIFYVKATASPGSSPRVWGT